MQIRRNAEKEKQKEPDSQFNLLYYTNFQDLRKIILRNENWHDIFEPYFRRVERVSSMLDELEPIRHRIAHTRKLSNEEFEKLDLFYRELKKMIG